MKETSLRLRSLAPARDKILNGVQWSAVVAGYGVMALFGRHAAITRFPLTNLPAMFCLPFSLSSQSVYIADSSRQSKVCLTISSLKSKELL